MANLKDIKRRIGSVKSTQKITNAMKLVSAAKFARASHAAEAARPYARALDQVVEKLLAGQAELQSPLLRSQEEKRVLLVMLATDRGLCGGLNSNLIKKAQSFIAEKNQHGVACELYACGRRSALFGRKAKLKLVGEKERVLEKGNIDTARELVQAALTHFLSGSYDRVYIL